MHDGHDYMRYAALAHYGVGKNRDADWAMRSGGSVRISELTHYQRVAGKLALRFPSGEKLDEDFTVDACPKKIRNRSSSAQLDRLTTRT